MTKTKSIVISVILAIITIAVAVLTFARFDLGGAKKYDSIFGLIEVGSDIEGSFVAEYTLADEEGSVSRTDLEKDVEIIRNRFNLNEFSTAVIKTTSRGFIVEIPRSENYSTALQYLGSQGKISFETTVKDDWLTEEDLNGAGADEAYAQDGIIIEQSGYAVTINFNSSGKEKFFNAAQAAMEAGDGSNYISIKMDGIELSRAQVGNDFTEPTSSIQITGNYTKAQAEIIASALNCGTLKYSYEQQAVKSMESILGSRASMWIVLGLFAMWLIASILFVIFYKGFGVIADIVMIIAVLIFTLIYSVIPVSIITIPSIIGMVLAFAILCGAMVYIFEKIKHEFSQGNTEVTAISNGFNKNYMLLIDILVIALISFLGGYFIVGAYLKTFILSFAVATAVAGVSAWLISRGLIALFKGMVNQKRFYGLKNEEEAENE